ncbi:Exodeoxyribonuclease III [Marinomonas spartinae]|uniref:Exodeoxyribonuclease III n=1 Tax=Marinomonas spartinae TaxID=1792290 RepID=A0A1A8TMD1_9GAMM|nr:exodeoxyribonuclease III [Marinomonas spartinae]SBS34271.1 Exodeoxyribonuclease III [Marinomonas spartinae]SBS34870.1 Exodeoxyribonuclease III [Marinomonas spartinae]
MKFVSFNINGLRARPHQIQALVEKHAPDVIGLQEIKVHDDAFPHDIPKSVGYHAYYYGQKSHYGVAIFSKKPALKVEYGFPGDETDAQRRMIIATFETSAGPVKVLNGYFPQGENRDHETKFPAKRKFYEDLMEYLAGHSPDEKIIVMGDINISPTDLDIGIGDANAKRWLKSGKCSFLPEEREWFKTLTDWGFDDTYRKLKPSINDRFSWFDYRSKGFDDEPKRGLRIDVILSSTGLTPYLEDSDVDYELRALEKPSDHAPIWSTFNVN